MKKLTVDEISSLRLKGGDWGETVNVICAGNTVLKFGYGFSYAPLGAFCVGWGVSKLLYK